MGKEGRFFACSSCFEESRVIYPYDSANDSGFRCRCGGKLERSSKYEAMLLFNE